MSSAQPRANGAPLPDACACLAGPTNASRRGTKASCSVIVAVAIGAFCCRNPAAARQSGVAASPTDRARTTLRIESCGGEQTFRCYSSLAVRYPRRRLVIYNGEPFNHIICRDCHARLVWRAATESAFGPSAFVAGGDALLVLGRDALPRASQILATGLHRALAASQYQWIDVFDIRSGKCLWQSTESSVGVPLWTNGRVFVAMRVRAASGAESGKRHHVNRGGVSAYLEQRRVTDMRLLWSHRFRVQPGVVERVVARRDANAVEFDLSRTRPFYSVSGSSTRLSAGVVLVPVLAGGVERPDSAPQVFAKDPDRRTLTIRNVCAGG